MECVAATLMPLCFQGILPNILGVHISGQTCLESTGSLLVLRQFHLDLPGTNPHPSSTSRQLRKTQHIVIQAKKNSVSTSNFIIFYPWSSSAEVPVRAQCSCCSPSLPPVTPGSKAANLALGRLRIEPAAPANIHK